MPADCLPVVQPVLAVLALVVVQALAKSPWGVFTIAASAFPAGPLRIQVLVPIPYT